MATECEEDLVEAATSLLAHGIELGWSELRVRPVAHGFEIDNGPCGAVKTLTLPDDAARYLIAALQGGGRTSAGP